MTNSNTNLSSQALAAVLTLVFSAVTVLGAVGPAVSGPSADRAIVQTIASGSAQGVANVPGKSANSLA